MTTYLQNRTDVRMTLTASLFSHSLAKKYPFIEPGKAIPVDEETLNKVFETNKTWAAWKEGEFVRVVHEEKTETDLVETITALEVPEDLNPESEGGKLDTTQGTDKAPRSRKK